MWGAVIGDIAGSRFEGSPVNLRPEGATRLIGPNSSKHNELQEKPRSNPVIRASYAIQRS